MLMFHRNRPRKIESLLAECRVGEHKGIILCSLREHSRSVESFLGQTREALDLIEFHDARRFNRIQRHIFFIADRLQVAPASYYRPLRLCLVDLGLYNFQEHPVWYRNAYASTLVHEATHGVVEEKSVPYNKSRRIRIERLCRQEERRFLQTVSPWPEQVQRPLNEEWLRQYFGFWSRLRLIFKRVNEIPDDELKYQI